MSALAKKMMEKYGWKEGEGLGKERSGMKSYVKVVRRDPTVATGLGHAADPAQGGSLASTHAVELDAIYGQLHKDKKKLKTSKRRRESSSSNSSTSSSSSDSGESDSDAEVVNGQESSGKESVERTSPTTQTARKGENKKKALQQESVSSASSGSDTDSDSDSDDDTARGQRYKDEAPGDVTRMSDKDLFQRCGGVRLGRAGRHRFFDGKLKRIHETHSHKKEKKEE